MNKFYKKISAVIVLLAIFVIFSSPVLAAEPTFYLLKNVKCALPGEAFQGQPGGPALSATGYKAAQPCTLCDFIIVFTNLSDMIIAASGAIALLMVVYAGILYLTASAKPANAESAKTTMVYVVIGLIVIFGAYAIVNFVFITLGGSKDSGALQAIYGQTTNQSTWGVCEETATK